MFGVAGGTIGRARHSDWVLPHNKVSSRHARVTYERSVFYIEDTSTNGIYLNSPDNRLEKGRLHPLHAGDRLFIEPYEISVSISSDLQETRLRPMAVPPPVPTPPRFESDPFAGLPPFGSTPVAPEPVAQGRPTPSPVPHAEDELDPLKLLGGGASGPPPESRNVVTARDLDDPGLGGHFQPPPVRLPPPPIAPPPPSSNSGGVFIPENYDPLAPETRSFPLADVPMRADEPPPPDLDLTPPPPPPLAPALVPPPASADEPPEEDQWLPPAVSGLPLVDDAPPPVEEAYQNRPTPPPRRATPAPSSYAAPAAPVPAPATGPVSEGHHGTDLAAILAGAGLAGAPVTAELTQKFGQILRVVVHGLMDVLRSRHQVKDEFRMRMTVVRPVDNNPLKLSANVDDALHNLLVKRNPAYLGPVEAFQDAFDDLRRHQLAMLAGMRVAFEHALAEFDADRLQAEFEKQVRKSSVFPIGVKVRYWDLYRDRQEEFAKDPEATFRRLFGDAFTQAYEEQMKRLKDEQGRG